MNFFLVNELVVLSKLQGGFNKFDDCYQRFILLVKNFKKKFDEKLNVIQTFAEVKNFELVVFILATQLIKFTHEGSTIHSQMQNVSL